MPGKLRFLFFLCGGIFLGACARDLPKSVPQSGLLFVSNRDGNHEIYLVQPDGSQLTRLTDHPEVDSDPAWSPDGSQIAFRSRRDGSSDIFIMAADGSQPYNLVNDPSDSFEDEFSPQWNPDGTMLAIYTDRFQPPIGNCKNGSLGVHHLGFISLENSDYFGNPAIVKHFDDLPGEQQTLGWAADGEFLAFSSICNQNKLQIYAWDRNSRVISALTGENYSASAPAFSPDGRYLAFSSDRDGPVDIYIMILDTGEIQNLTDSPSLDRQPTWSPDSAFLAFTTNRDGNNEIYIIDLPGENLSNITQNPADDFLPAWSPIVP